MARARPASSTIWRWAARSTATRSTRCSRSTTTWAPARSPRGGARSLGFGDGLGVIERGALADLVAYRLDAVPFTPLHDPVCQLIYGERRADIDFVMVNGEVALRDGRFTRVDEARLLAEIQAEGDALAAQLAASEASVAPVRAAIPTDTYPARLP